MGSKNRADLYKLFKTGNKPTEDDFADLIDSMVNIAEDGLGVAEKGEPLELTPQGNHQRWLDFSSAKDSPVWRINAQSATGAMGLNIATADNTSRLYIKRENGFVGVNNAAPGAQLHIAAASGGAALQVDCGANQTALVVDADGNLGIGTASTADCRVTVDGPVKLQGETTLVGAVAAQQGLTVSGAALTARQGLNVQNGLTVESGHLEAKAGLTVTGNTLNANDGAIVSGSPLQAQKGLRVSDGAVIESGALLAQAGGVVSGASFTARDGFTASKGAVISGGQLEVQAGASVAGGRLTAEDGLTVTGGAVIETGKLAADQGLTVNQGAVVETGELKARQGLTVNQGAVVETGELEARQGLSVNRGAVVKTGQLEAKEGLTVDQGAVIATGTLEAKAGLMVTGTTTLHDATVIESGILTANGGLTVPNGSVLTAAGQVSLGNADNGTVASNGVFFARQGLKVEQAKLEAAAGAVVSGAELLVEQGLTVADGATFKTGTLTADPEAVTVSGGATFKATGPVTMGNTANGTVTVNGGLQATNGAVISGAELVAANGLSVAGTLNVPDSAFIGTASIDSLSVDNINIVGNFGLQKVDLTSVTAAAGTIGMLTVEDAMKVAAPCLFTDSVLFETGMVYVSYEGAADVQPRLQVVSGTLTTEKAGHFAITIDEDKVLTITYNEDSKFSNLTEDWKAYQAAQPGLTAGFKLIQVGRDNTWELQDRAIGFTATKPYRDYIDTATGLWVIYTVATDKIPKFKITANQDTAAVDFEFEVSETITETETDYCLVIKYPAVPENCTLSKLISDWEVFISEAIENADHFELRKTADSTGTALVTARESTVLEVNPTGNAFYQAVLKTNSVLIGGNLKFYDSTLEMNSFSNSVTLVENSDTCLPTQKAVKTYVDNGLALKADITTMNSELAKKADKTTMASELEQKADKATMVSELEQKADKATMASELEQKADKAMMASELEQKADKTTMASELEQKADKTTMASELEQKADKATMVSELEQKADKATMASELEQKADKATMANELAKKADLSSVTEQLAQKADQAVMLTALTSKAGLVPANDLMVAAASTGAVSGITLTDHSRGLLMVRVTPAAGAATAGLLALHGTESLLKIAGAGLADQKDQAGTCNLYLDAGVITVQNATTEAITVTVSYLGV